MNFRRGGNIVDRAEVLNKQINDYAYALSNMLIELHDKYGIDRRQEILEYLQEKLKNGE